MLHEKLEICALRYLRCYLVAIESLATFRINLVSSLDNRSLSTWFPYTWENMGHVEIRFENIVRVSPSIVLWNVYFKHGLDWNDVIFIM